MGDCFEGTVKPRTDPTLRRQESLLRRRFGTDVTGQDMLEGPKTRPRVSCCGHLFICCGRCCASFLGCCCTWICLPRQRAQKKSGVPKLPARSISGLPLTPLAFSTHSGKLVGAELMCTRMTVAEARIKCLELSGCMGFTFQGNPRDEMQVQIHFMRTWDLDGSVQGWTSVAYKDWFNQGVLLGWPYASEAMAKKFKAAVERVVLQKIQQYGHGIADFEFKKISVGNKPPIMRPFRTYAKEEQEEYGVQVDMHIRYDEDIDVQMEFGALGSLSMTHAFFDGIVCFLVKPILYDMPVMGGTQIFVLNEPTIELEFGSSMGAITKLPFIQPTVQAGVQQAFRDKFVLPRRLWIPFTRLYHHDLATLRFPPPEGILRVTVLKAEGLPATCMANAVTCHVGALNPFVEVKLGRDKLRTSTVFRSTKPAWNEEEASKDFFVYNPRQHVQIQLYSASRAKKPDLICSMSTATVWELLAGQRQSHTEEPHYRSRTYEQGTHGQSPLTGFWVPLSSDDDFSNTSGPKLLLALGFYKLHKLPPSAQAQHDEDTPCTVCETNRQNKKLYRSDEGHHENMSADGEKGPGWTLQEAQRAMVLSNLPKIMLALKLHSGFPVSKHEDWFDHRGMLGGSVVLMTVDGESFKSNECLVRPVSSIPSFHVDERTLSIIAALKSKNMPSGEIATVVQLDQAIVDHVLQEPGRRMGLEWNHAIYKLLANVESAEVLLQLKPPQSAEPLAETTISLSQTISKVNERHRVFQQFNFCRDDARQQPPRYRKGMAAFVLDIEVQLRTTYESQLPDLPEEQQWNGTNIHPFRNVFQRDHGN